MTVNGIELNTMFVERTENGDIILYGSHYEREQKLVVVRSTKNNPTLSERILGTNYTNEMVMEKLKERPRHNFIGWLGSPLSMPISMEKVTFVD